MHRDHGRAHDEVVCWLAEEIRSVLGDEFHDAVTGGELVFEAFDAVVCPDVVVSGSCNGEPPKLVVEVSAHTSRIDGLEKALLYARAGVTKYWQIDLWRVIYTHPSPHGEGYGMRSCTAGVFSELGNFHHLTAESIFAVADAASSPTG